ncbi:MAG TPA: hypothetical protein VIP05_21550 [Burkholderiaceae bacterium]
MKPSLPVIALALAMAVSIARASDPRLLIPVTFDAAAQVPDDVRSDCGLDYKLQEEAAQQLKAHDPAWEPTETLDGRVIRIAILDVKDAGATFFTASKSLSARVQLLEDGQVRRSTVMHITASVPLEQARRICTILDRAARGLGKRTAEWARHPEKKYKDNDDDVVAAPAAPAPNP